MFLWLDPLYLILVATPGVVIGGIATLRVKSAFARYSRVRASSGLTGAQAAGEMLAQAGLGDRISIERIGGFLSDHYDSRMKVLRLSPDVFDGDSLAAVGVACHEAGHALQDARGYAPLVLRNLIVPTAGIGSNLGYLLIILGLVLSGGRQEGFGYSLAVLGLLLFSSVAVFQIVNLPVEFNASRRAREELARLGMISGPQEAAAVRAVLGAAAMTYVAATVTALLNLLYFAMLIFGGRRRR